MTLRWVPGWNGLTEPEAVSYVAAVEAADEQELEFGVAKAINDFVLGCKTDGIWDAIKACNILAGARTLNGAFVPLVKQPADSAPARFGTEGGWNYNRETGLQGNGTDNYINSGRNNNADPQDSRHLAIFVSTASTGTLFNRYIAAGDSSQGDSYIAQGDGATPFINTCSSSGNYRSSFSASSTGFIGHSRSSSSSYALRCSSTNVTAAKTSTTPRSESVAVFGRPQETSPTRFTNGRLAFYSIGESLDLEKLDNRVTRLMNLITYTQTAGLPDLATMDIDAAAYIGGGYRVGGTLS